MQDDRRGRAKSAGKKHAQGVAANARSESSRAGFGTGRYAVEGETRRQTDDRFS
jgi:hypothetical protein